MINKQLIALVPQSKKYVAYTVVLKCLALFSNIIMIFTVADLIKLRSLNNVLDLITIIISLVLSFVCAQLSAVTSYKSSAEVKKTLRSLIYQKLLRIGAGYHQKTETAKIIQMAVEGVEQIEVWFGQYLPQFFYSMIASLATFAVLAFVNLKMAVILLCCVPLIPMSIVAVQKIAKKILGKYMDQYASLADNYLENLQGLTTLKIYSADEMAEKKLSAEAENFRRVTMKVLSFQLNSIIIMDIVAYAGAGLGIVAALQSYLSGNMTIENTVICILISADFFIPLRRLGSYFHTAMNGNTASKNIFKLLEIEEVKQGSMVLDSNTSEKAQVFTTQDLSYSFDNRTVLDKVNITIDKGSYTAFVGKSGSGKSTTAKVLAGIYNQYEGQALCNGIEIKDINCDSLFEYCTYISHKGWIFKGTVKDCLLEGNPNATEEQLWAALKSVKLEGFIKENNGLEMQILENASNLSGGQKQRLSIARALLHDSCVYIFDEATSNIDVESEQAILELLHQLKGNKTIIMISHRSENCIGSDKIYSFENGKCVLMGGTK